MNMDQDGIPVVMGLMGPVSLSVDEFTEVRNLLLRERDRIQHCCSLRNVTPQELTEYYRRERIITIMLRREFYAG